MVFGKTIVLPSSAPTDPAEYLLRSSLTAPYQEPFEVLSMIDKHFTIKRNNRITTKNIDRLKSAFLLNDSYSTKEPFPVQIRNNPVVHTPRLHSVVPVPNTTHSGRKVKFNPKIL
ncbi:hypothetical protein NPIL_130371 [Nephila pilipes]|uniref:Uncharacterized protein n=1 Tax=Nephila pilipes TaxID=299642 RepID=A0A8X6U145_NEPPI|nr:hypothetical protein NPIL_130371 [Nephila pilipes]